MTTKKLPSFMSKADESTERTTVTVRVSKAENQEFKELCEIAKEQGYTVSVQDLLSDAYSDAIKTMRKQFNGINKAQQNLNLSS